MLILTRRQGEELKIGEGDDTITVSVLSVKGNQARLGVKAPQHLPVHRKEIWDRIQADKEALAV